jgi:hypothetical protein
MVVSAIAERITQDPSLSRNPIFPTGLAVLSELNRITLPCSSARKRVASLRTPYFRGSPIYVLFPEYTGESDGADFTLNLIDPVLSFIDISCADSTAPDSPYFPVQVRTAGISEASNIDAKRFLLSDLTRIDLTAIEGEKETIKYPDTFIDKVAESGSFPLWTEADLAEIDKD